MSFPGSPNTLGAMPPAAGVSPPSPASSATSTDSTASVLSPSTGDADSTCAATWTHKRKATDYPGPGTPSNPMPSHISPPVKIQKFKPKAKAVEMAKGDEDLEPDELEKRGLVVELE